MQENPETLLQETSELLNRLMPVVARSINALQHHANPLLQHLIQHEVEHQEDLLQQIEEIKRKAEEYLDLPEVTVIWTAERFRELISREKHRVVYEKRKQIERLSELGADLMELVRVKEWELTYKFNKTYFAFYLQNNPIFGIYLTKIRYPRLCVWVREGDLTEIENDWIKSNVPFNRKHENYYDWPLSTGLGTYSKDTEVKDIEVILEFIYLYWSGE